MKQYNIILLGENHCVGNKTNKGKTEGKVLTRRIRSVDLHVKKGLFSYISFLKIKSVYFHLFYSANDMLISFCHCLLMTTQTNHIQSLFFNVATT